MGIMGRYGVHSPQRPIFLKCQFLGLFCERFMAKKGIYYLLRDANYWLYLVQFLPPKRADQLAT